MNYYRHYHVAKGKTSHITFAGTFREGNFYVAAALCSRKDRFSRHIGRDIAEKRLVNCPTLVPKSSIYQHCVKLPYSVFKLPALEMAIASAPIYDFNINTLFEVALCQLFTGVPE